MKKRFFYFLFILVLTISCQEKKDLSSNNQFDKLSDSLYKKHWLQLEFDENSKHLLELYITKEQDSFINQHKVFKNDALDTLNSVFYDLIISETDKIGFYKGKIILFNRFKDVKLDTYNTRTLFFNFISQNKDSLWTNTITSNNTIIEFEFENYYAKRLQGSIFETITLEKNENEVNVHQLEIAVDNYNFTNNIFFQLKENKNKFTINNNTKPKK